LILFPVARIAALSLSFVGVAHAAGGGNRNESWPSGGAPTQSAEVLPLTTAIKRQLIRASWYGGGERLASHTSTGELFRPMGHTAAHRTLPFGTMLKVTSASSGRSTIVRINDRGPAAASGRSLDLSRGAALDLGIVASGEGRVFIEVLQ
jgi:rare lipoprotein A